MRILYFTSISSSAFAFLGGMATCAVVIWMCSAPPPAAPASAADRRAPVPQSVLDGGYGASYWLMVSEPAAGGFRFPSECDPALARRPTFGHDLHCAAVREAVASGGGRLGMQVLRLDGCDTCRALGLKPGDVVTHVARNRVRPAIEDQTPTYLAWFQSGRRDRQVTTLTLRVLREGRPAVLTRRAPAGGPP